MTKLLTAAAAAAMIFGASAGHAQNAETETQMFVTGEGETLMLMGGADEDGSQILMGESFAVPADCPEGSFYMSSESTVTACGEGGAAFDVAEPDSGMMMSSGEAFPEGARILRPKESGEQKM